MGRAERGDAEVVVDGRLEVEEAVGTNSSRRKAKRAAKIEELAGVNEAKEGIFFPAKETVKPLCLKEFIGPLQLLPFRTLQGRMNCKSNPYRPQKTEVILSQTTSVFKDTFQISLFPQGIFIL